jgi:hypothetical protein
LLILPNAQLARHKAIEAIRYGLDVPKRELSRWPGAAMLFA